MIHSHHDILSGKRSLIIKTKIQTAISFISLAALLVYTFVHTGGLLSGYVQPLAVGYVAAFGIEMSIVSLSLRIGELRRARADSGFFLFVLVSVVIVSAIANIAEGFETSQGIELTTDTMKRLDIVQATIGLVATGLISLIVLALSEIIGTDVYKTGQTQGSDKSLSKQERQAKILTMDKMDKEEIAKVLGVSVKTIERDMVEMNGQLK